MTKVLVDAKALERVLNYMMEDEYQHYNECQDIWGWDSEQLKGHVYMSLERLEIDFLKGKQNEKV